MFVGTIRNNHEFFIGFPNTDYQTNTTNQVFLTTKEVNCEIPKVVFNCWLSEKSFPCIRWVCCRVGFICVTWAFEPCVFGIIPMREFSFNEDFVRVEKVSTSKFQFVRCYRSLGESEWIALFTSPVLFGQFVRQCCQDAFHWCFL